MYFWIWLESYWIWECKNEPMKEVYVHIINLSVSTLAILSNANTLCDTYFRVASVVCDNIPCHTRNILVSIIGKLVY